VNKAELIDALSARLGDKRAATQALDAVLAEIQNAVTKGDKVAITGFGVFEKKVRAARTARNPRTGEAVKVKKTSVPAFRPGAGFRELVASGKVPKVAGAKKTVSKAATKTAATKATATKATTSRAATKTAATKATKAAPAKKTAAKTTKAAAAPAARKTATAKATTAKATTAKATTAKATTAKATTAKATTAKAASPTKKAAPAKKR
jgi:DNA-binding protein HU-beta